MEHEYEIDITGPYIREIDDLKAEVEFWRGKAEKHASAFAKIAEIAAFKNEPEGKLVWLDTMPPDRYTKR